MRVPFACNLRQGKVDVISYSAAISACEKARRASVALEAWLLLDDGGRPWSSWSISVW